MVIYTRKGRRYHGFELPRGAYYGADEKGYFICTPNALETTGLNRALSYLLHVKYGIVHVSEDTANRNIGNNAVMRVYRLHPERGWCPEWERSETTAECVRRMLHDNVKIFVQKDWNNAPRNLLARVANDGGTVWVSSIPGYSLMS